MQGFLLQPWVTVHCSATSVVTFTPDEQEWIDLSSFADAVFWVDVSEVTAPSGSPTPSVQLTLQGSPSHDDSFFQPVAPPVTLVASPTPTIIKTTLLPSTMALARWVRWQLTLANPQSGSWGATFRIRAVPYKQSFFLPTQIPGCALWLRADLGTTLVGSPGSQTVSQWNDQSGSGDAAKNLAQGTTTRQPSYSAANGLLNGQATLTFVAANNLFMTSGAWASVLGQPTTWVVVARNVETGTSTEYLLDGNDTTHGQAIEFAATSPPAVTIFANGTALTWSNAGASWNPNAKALLGEWNGSTSNIYFNNFTTASVSGTVGGGTAGAQASMTLGSHNQASGGGSNWDGDVAEIIAYSGILAPKDKSRLRNYLNGRYGLSIG
jgi:hypothetical protein